MKELFNNGMIKVYTNGFGEIFIERLKSVGKGVVVRIGQNPQGLEITADSATFQPTSFNGLGGFIIR